MKIWKTEQWFRHLWYTTLCLCICTKKWFLITTLVLKLVTRKAVCFSLSAYNNSDNLTVLTLYGYFGMPAPPALLYKYKLSVILGWNKEDVYVIVFYWLAQINTCFSLCWIHFEGKKTIYQSTSQYINQWSVCKPMINRFVTESNLQNSLYIVLG